MKYKYKYKSILIPVVETKYKYVYIPKLILKYTYIKIKGKRQRVYYPIEYYEKKRKPYTKISYYEIKEKIRVPVRKKKPKVVRKPKVRKPKVKRKRPLKPEKILEKIPKAKVIEYGHWVDALSYIKNILDEIVEEGEFNVSQEFFPEYRYLETETLYNSNQKILPYKRFWKYLSYKPLFYILIIGFLVRLSETVVVQKQVFNLDGEYDFETVLNYYLPKEVESFKK